MARASAPSRAYTHAFLGVNYHDDDGVTRIFGVVSQTGAAQVGIVPGDIVVSYDGEPVDQNGEFGALIRSSPIGHRPLVVLRRGETSIEVRPMLSAIVHRTP
jgi:S1-C subfamily serine protease